ncbi:hypothetical protein BGX34_006574 [Mortierella sp. NVP85]|nr:hypothetical protein BGX34_006574 [Mortierella sp. NVP85]
MEQFKQRFSSLSASAEAGFEPVLQKTRRLDENLSAILQIAQESKARNEDVRSGLDDLAENIGEGFKKVEASTEVLISRTQGSFQGMMEKQLKTLGEIDESHERLRNRTDDLQAKLEKASCGFFALFYIPMTMMGIV